MRRTFAGSVLPIAVLVGCTIEGWERDRRSFVCGATKVVVSTRQRVPDALGGEEYVFAKWSFQGRDFVPQIDNNGRWTERLSASVASDGSWIRLHLSDAGSRYTPVAYAELATGRVIRFAHEYSTPKEREAGWFAATPELSSEQVVRGRRVSWRACQ